MRHCVILPSAIDEEARAKTASQWTTVTFLYVDYISGGEGLSQMIHLRYQMIQARQRRLQNRSPSPRHRHRH